MSDSNRVNIKYVMEATATYGQTPVGSGNWVETRFTSDSLVATPRTVTSNEVRADRMIADLRKVGLDVGGTLEHEFSAASFDDLIEAAMCGKWTANVVDVGVYDRSFTIEKNFEDVATAIYSFKGQRVGQWVENFAYGEVVTGSFLFTGNGVSAILGTAVSAYTTANANAVFDAATGISSIMVDNVHVTDCLFRSLTFTVDNTQRLIEAMGFAAPCDVGKGRANITGSMELYFKASAKNYVSVMLANNPINFQFTVTDGTKGYIIRWPRMMPANGFPTADGVDTDVMLAMDFTATMDTSAGTSMRVTRF